MPTTIDIKKEEHYVIENVFGKPPGWILRWGISIGFLFLLALVGLAAFIKYPDKLAMKGQYIAGQRPIEVVPKISGRIDHLYVQDKDTLQANSPILRIQSTIDSLAIEQFLSFAQKWENTSHIPHYLHVHPPSYLALGEFSSSYSQLVKNIEEFQLFLSDGSVFSRIRGLQSEVTYIDKLNQSLRKQENFYEKDVALTEKDYRRQETLLSGGVIAEAEKEKSESGLLAEKRNLESFKTQIINNQVRAQQLNTQITDLTAERRNGVNNRLFVIAQQIKDLKSLIMEWQDKHILMVPMTGILSEKMPLSKNLYIKAGEPIVTIIPTEAPSSGFVEGLVPVRGAGTLKIGQRALIELENYPQAQFGVIIGEVDDISLIPAEDNFRVKINLQQGLTTTYNKTFPDATLLTASVSINTQEYTLLQRLFQNIWDVAKNRNN